MEEVVVIVHLLAAMVWVGGSVALVFAGVPAIRTLEGEPRGRAMRALVVDAEQRVLLMRFENPANDDVWWATPGGGVEGAESDETALRRELLEEAGLRDPEIGPVVWVREHVLPWDRQLWRQRERFHLVRVGSLEATPTIDLVAEHVYGHRWWTLAELEATDQQLAPRALATHLRALLRDGPPSEPVDVSH